MLLKTVILMVENIGALVGESKRELYIFCCYLLQMSSEVNIYHTCRNKLCHLGYVYTPGFR